MNKLNVNGQLMFSSGVIHPLPTFHSRKLSNTFVAISKTVADRLPRGLPIGDPKSVS